MKMYDRQFRLFLALVASIGMAGTLAVVVFLFPPLSWRHIITAIIVAAIYGIINRTVIWRYTKSIAGIDSLTGLPNNKLFEYEVGGYRFHSSHGSAVIVIDINDFKEINDTKGHAAGDAALAALGSIILRSVRASDRACRFGGDEFMILLPRITSANDPIMVAMRILELLESPIRFGNSWIRIEISAGIAYSSSDDTMKELRKKADDQMYRAKRRSKETKTNCLAIEGTEDVQAIQNST